MQEQLRTLKQQMEREFHNYSEAERQRIYTYMVFAFERGEQNAIRKINDERP